MSLELSWCHWYNWQELHTCWLSMPSFSWWENNGGSLKFSFKDFDEYFVGNSFGYNEGHEGGTA